jgi:hypothetical protein
VFAFVEIKVERLPSALVKAEGKGLARLRPPYLCQSVNNGSAVKFMRTVCLPNIGLK